MYRGQLQLTPKRQSDFAWIGEAIGDLHNVKIMYF